MKKPRIRLPRTLQRKRNAAKPVFDSLPGLTRCLDATQNIASGNDDIGNSTKLVRACTRVVL